MLKVRVPPAGVEAIHTGDPVQGEAGCDAYTAVPPPMLSPPLLNRGTSLLFATGACQFVSSSVSIASRNHAGYAPLAKCQSRTIRASPGSCPKRSEWPGSGSPARAGVAAIRTAVAAARTANERFTERAPG